MKKNHGATLLALLLAIGGIVAWLILPVLSAETSFGGVTVKGELSGMATIFGGKIKLSSEGVSIDIEVLALSKVLVGAFAAACLGAFTIVLKLLGAKSKVIIALIILILLAGAAVVIFLTKTYAVVKDTSYNLEDFKLGYGAYIAMGCLGLAGLAQFADLK